MRPPTPRLFSNTVTSRPASASRRAQTSPEIPPPITATLATVHSPFDIVILGRGVSQDGTVAHAASMTSEDRALASILRPTGTSLAGVCFCRPPALRWNRRFSSPSATDCCHQDPFLVRPCHPLVTLPISLDMMLTSPCCWRVSTQRGAQASRRILKVSSRNRTAPNGPGRN